MARLRCLRFVLLSWLAFQLALTGEDWPQFLGPNRDGSSSGAGVAAKWPKEGPKRLWKRKTGEGFAGPVVSGNRLILFHRAGDTEIAECLDAKTGHSMWAAAYPTAYRDDFRFEEGPRATPAIADGFVYSMGAEGMIQCLSLEKGTVRWRVAAKDEFKSEKGFFGMACSPLVTNGMMILNIGGEDGAGIVALSSTNGALIWKSTKEEASYSSPVIRPINGKPAVLCFARSGLFALDPKDGAVRFQFPWRARTSASVNAATPLVSGDMVFLSASYQAGAAMLRIGNGRPAVVWSGDDILSNHYSTSVWFEGNLYGFDGRQEEGQQLRCVDALTGKVRWTKENFGAGTLMVAGRELLVLTEKGELVRVAADPAGYREKDRAQIVPGKVRAYPALANGLYFAKTPSELACFDLGTAAE